MIGQEEYDRDERIFRRGRESAGLGLETLRSANEARAARWHPGFPTDMDWTLGDWGNAMGGEAGEAQNVIKKIRRVETDKQRRDSEGDIIELVDKLADELADMIIYADLVAAIVGIDLTQALKIKFNATSMQYGFPERL
jgi:NTP pyrophosphatase (non-canonical NTP hydrolase)